MYPYILPSLYIINGTSYIYDISLYSISSMCFLPQLTLMDFPTFLKGPN